MFLDSEIAHLHFGNPTYIWTMDLLKIPIEYVFEDFAIAI